MSEEQSLFERLSKINVNEHVEKKGKFSYLSWAWAWRTLKEHCPDATFNKHIFYDDTERQVPFLFDKNTGCCYVMVTVTAGGESHSEILPVLNHQNKPIQNPNSFDVNTSLQRCLVKAIAMHGLGLYIYAGEDVPDGSSPYTPAEEREMEEQHKKNGIAF